MTVAYRWHIESRMPPAYLLSLTFTATYSKLGRRPILGFTSLFKEAMEKTAHVAQPHGCRSDAEQPEWAYLPRLKTLLGQGVGMENVAASLVHCRLAVVFGLSNAIHFSALVRGFASQRRPQGLPLEIVAVGKVVPAVVIRQADAMTQDCQWVGVPKAQGLTFETAVPDHRLRVSVSEPAVFVERRVKSLSSEWRTTLEFAAQTYRQQGRPPEEAAALARKDTEELVRAVVLSKRRARLDELLREGVSPKEAAVTARREAVDSVHEYAWRPVAVLESHKSVLETPGRFRLIP